MFINSEGLARAALLLFLSCSAIQLSNSHTQTRLHESPLSCTVRALTMRGLFPPNTFSFEQMFNHWSEKCKHRKF